MMAEDVFQLEKWKAQFVHQNKSYIEELFGIKINLSGISGNDDSQFSLAPRNRTLCVVSSESTLESVSQAKEFILSQTSEENTKQAYYKKCCDQEVSLLLQEKSNIEKSSDVKINFDHSSKVAEIVGSIQNIVHAKTSIENMVRELDLTSKSQLDSGGMKILHSDCGFIPEPYLVIGDKSKLNSVTRSFSLADDSSLQTDFFQPVRTQQGLGTTKDINSYDVSISPGCLTPELRSVSPQELYYQANGTEDMELSVDQLRISSPALSRSSESVTSLVEEDIGRAFIPQKVPDYESKVEFALKLGYTENQLIQALENLGPCGDNQNELLSELIKVASTPKGLNDINGASDFLSYNSDPVSDIGEEDTNFTLSDRVKVDPASNLRTIVIDGSNVAMSHGNKEIFSCKGIQLAVDWFRSRGHKDITVFVPQWRKETSRSDARIKDQEMLNQLEREKVLVFTPARRIGGRRVVCYDDRYVLKLAVETNGIIVSNDNYRDLANENSEFKKVVEERLLMYSFVNDRFMPPDDPLGRNGPSLDNFLQKEPTLPEPLPPLCPYGSKKCTYGNKCKYYHPERRNQPQKTVTEKLAEQARQNLQERERVKATASEGEKKKITRTKTPLGRTRSVNPDQSLADASVSSSKSPRQESQSLEDPSYRSGEEDQVLKSDTKEKDERYIEFNQRLDEQRRKLEIPLKKENQREKQDPSMSQWSFGNPNEKTRCLSASINLPAPVPQYDIKEKFLSGHLLLAKKLSDEATESQIWKQCGESEDHSPRGQHVYGSTPGTSPTASPQKGQNKPRAIVKQKLCRQYSLQGQEDPRLHKQLQGQNSCDPRFLGSNVGTVSLTNCDNYSSSSLQADFMRGQQHQERISCYPRSSTDSARLNTFGSQNMRELQYPHQTFSEASFQSKAALARMQSAPVTCATLHQPQQQPPTQHRPFSQMIRQNSTSDPQLHKHNDDGHPPLSQLAPRQSLPIHDSAGNVTFQITGRPSQPVGYSSYSPSTFPQPSYHHPPPPNPQYSAQYQQGIDYGFSYHGPSGMMHTGLHSGQPFCCATSSSGDSAANFGNMLQNTSGSLWSNTRTMSNPVSRSSPHPSFAVDAPVPISDPRCDLYYKLCNLFPEQKVREVMNSHPETDDINDICAYIIGAKK